MRTVGIGRLVLDEFAKALDVVFRFGRGGERREIDAAVGADDARRSVGEFDVGRQRPPVRRRRASSASRPGRRRRAPPKRRRAGWSASRPCRRPCQFVAVALAHIDLVDVEAELVGDELRIGGRVSLAVGLGADIDRDRAVPAASDAPPRSRRRRRPRYRWPCRCRASCLRPSTAPAAWSKPAQPARSMASSMWPSNSPTS
jgi:hypothetical protein